ncbi:hypothetical protein CQ13_09735 [Bradyrhizobium retamae]|uniref:Uncharacterized protein n=1 Tax=Bradyrhizobium retamae TaxID=1300035 RepID=A0A0R3MML9_9BRAD|nr:hypothetical protein CQ13_09735 [Bradyrhizobium retamae]
MQLRAIRAWHYTRLVDDEVRIIQENGIYPGTLETLKLRLDALVAAGLITTADAKALYAATRAIIPSRNLVGWANSGWHPIPSRTCAGGMAGGAGGARQQWR